MMRGFRWAAYATVIALVAASPAFARSVKIYAKAGATPDELSETLDLCEKGGKGTGGAQVQPLPIGAPPTAAGPVGDAIGATIGTAIGQAYWDVQLRKARLPHCMRAHGVAQVELTKSESAEYSSLSGENRQAWLAGFLRGDIGQRVSEALRPLSEPLPTAKDEPYLVAGVRIDPRSVEIASEAVRDGDVILRGLGGYRSAARVSADGVIATAAVGVFGMGPVTVPPDTVFHQVYVGRPARNDYFEDRTLWCGPGEYAKGVKALCIASGYNGYRTLFHLGPAWLGFVDPLCDPADFLGKPMPIRIEEIDPASLGSFPFELQIVHVSSRGVELKAVGRRGEEEGLFYRTTLYFDRNGNARLPFWDRTLVLSRYDGSVTGSFEPRTDGRGWYDLAPNEIQQVCIR